MAVQSRASCLSWGIPSPEHTHTHHTHTLHAVAAGPDYNSRRRKPLRSSEAEHGRQSGEHLLPGKGETKNV